jgi:membrane fusion protein, multidrug efflux system
MEEKNGKNKKALIFMTVFGLGLLAALAFYFFHSAGHVTTDDAYVDGRVHVVAPRVGGMVVKIYAEDNQLVKSGDLLVEIDPKDYELHVKEAQAALESEKARLLDAQAGVRAAQANVALQDAVSNQAKLDNDRAQKLFKEGVVSKEKQEKALTALDLAQAQSNAAKEGLEKAQSYTQLEAAQLKQREATLNIADLNLSYTKITAPCDGYVTKKNVELGNQAQPMQPLLAVVALGDVWVTANFKETQLKNVKAGQRVHIKIDTFPNRVFYGKVQSIMAGTGAVFSLFPPENALGNYVKVVQRIPVKIVFDSASDAQHLLRVGMSCIPTIITRDE